MTAELATRADEPAAPDRTGRAWGRLRLSWPGAVATVLAVVQLGWFTAELLRGFFWQDDFVYLYLGGTVSLTGLLGLDYNGHLQPGAFAVSWLLAHTAPLSWPAAVLPLVALQGVALLLWWRLLILLFGSRRAILLPFAAVVCSPLTFGLAMWWSYGLQLLPMQAAMAAALYAHLTHLRTPANWRAGAALAATAFGLAFWEKAAFIPPLLLAVTLVLARRGWVAPGVLRRHARLFAGYGALLAGYAALHLALAPPTDGYTPGVAEVLSLAGQLLGDGLAPALFGGPWSGDWAGLRGLAPQAGWVHALAWTLSAVVVAAGLWRGRGRAALAWLVLAGYLAASVLLVAFGRFGGQWQAIVGTDPRYVADAVPVAALCAALAFLRPGRLGGPDGQGQPGRLAVGWRRALPRWLAVGLAVALLATGSAVSIAGALGEQRHRPARDYVHNVRAAARLDPGLTLYDTAVPAEVLLRLFGEEPLTSQVLHGLRLRIDRPTERLHVLDPAGVAHPVGLVGAAAALPGPVPGCGYLTGAAIAQVPLAGQVGGTRLVARVGYYSQTGWNGVVSTPGGRVPLRFEPGVHAVFLVVDGPVTELLVQADGPVCITDVLVGKPLPQPK